MNIKPDYRNTKKAIRITFLTLLFVISGCALSPQVVNISPEITITRGATDKDKTRLTLEVQDNRASSVLGKRGGVYSDTATVSTQGDITAALHEKLSTALKEMGYRIVTDGSIQPLKVEVTALEYNVQKNKVTRIIETHASINAAYSKGNKHYNNTYKITRTKKMLTAPNMEENETLINETLAEALQRMLADEKLFGLIDE